MTTMPVVLAYEDESGAHVEETYHLTVVPRIGDTVSLDTDGPTYSVTDVWWFFDDSEPDPAVHVILGHVK